MAQQEQSHAYEMRKTGLEGAIRKDRRGQYLGGLVALFVAPRVLERHNKRDNQGGG